MPIYTTKRIINFTTRKPFEFEISTNQLRFINRYGKGTPEEDPSEVFAFFPSYEKVREIFFEDGYTTELITSILTDFGVPVNLIPKLLANKRFVSAIRPWFKGISNDGERAARTLMYVYKAAEDPVLTIDEQEPPLLIS